MHYLILLVALFSANFLPQPAAAEEQGSTSELDSEFSAATSTTLPGTTTTTAPRGRVTKEELLEFEMLLTENNFIIEGTDRNRSELVTIYERLLGRRCMPQIFKTLTYTGTDRSGSCNELLTKLLKIDPFNPLAICVQKGIDHQECRLGYKELAIRPGNVSSALPMQSADEAERKILESKIGNQVAKLEATIDAIDESEEEKIKRLRLQVLSLACENWKIRLVAGQETTSHRSSSASPVPSGSPLPTYKRSRVISDLCDSRLTRYAEFYPDLAAITCHRYGAYSPQCIDALRLERRSKSQQRGSAEQPAPANDLVGKF